MFDAASSGDLAAVEAALAGGADVHARGEYGDTALNVAAEHGHLAVVERLLSAGADLENRGGADKTPVMNAAFAGHVDVVRLLVDRGARINNDLLQSVQMKVNILKENAESGMVKPEAAEAWEGFLHFLLGRQLKQNLPEVIEALGGPDRGEAVKSVNRAAQLDFDISAALPALADLLADADGDTRYYAASALTRTRDWGRVSAQLTRGDKDVREGTISALVDVIRAGADVGAVVPSILGLFGAAEPNLRHDGAAAIGYAATNGLDVTATVPNLVTLLSDEHPQVRKISAWALYRVATRVGDISAAFGALEALANDEDEDVRGMAAEALQAGRSRGS